jgi:hypothetical protein
MKDRLLAKLPTQVFHPFVAQRVFVADFTDFSKSERGLEAHTIKPSDIESFVIENPASVTFLFAPFAANQLLNAEWKEIEHCECVFFPNDYEMDISWLLFLELKHSKAHKSGGHLQKAMGQLFSTLDYFRANAIISPTKTVHLVVSIPNRYKVPFENSLLTPAELKEIRKQHHAIVRGTNQVLIESNQKLKV